jgi:hypothetical protein
MSTLERAVHSAREAEDAQEAARQLKHSKEMALQLYGSRKQAKVYLLHGEAVVPGDKGPKRVPGGKTFLFPDDKGNPTTRSRHSREDMRKFAKEKVHLKAEYEAAFKMACTDFQAAIQADTGESAEECCRRAEEKHLLPVGSVLSPKRIANAVREAAGGEDFTVKRHGPKVDDELEIVILDAVLSDVEVNAIKGVSASPADVTGRAQSLFRVNSLPCKSKGYIWTKLRERNPDVCRCVSAADGRDHLRLLWTTADNLNIWHPG